MASSLANHSSDQSVKNCCRPAGPVLSLWRADEPETNAPLPPVDTRGGGARSSVRRGCCPLLYHCLPHPMVDERHLCRRHVVRGECCRECREAEGRIRMYDDDGEDDEDCNTATARLTIGHRAATASAFILPST